MSEVYRVISEESGGISSDVTVICCSSGGRKISASCEAEEIAMPHLIVDIQRQCHRDQV